ncbi:hypothetical protein GCM10010472_74400 [Pseudonocardia halophobica]|uniref:DUF998 domain-containing protein n=1 Tax=Pseudonocardia halophobica TaxID=29401 RepID=A0A9W6P1R7_9PSEU|nr:DUF998 domain-containing protein [Pseudonocardia halophobica]GLL16213.1 hypothetical protein GCM10017577_73700 [Pseudonocardia halophobica]
MEHDTAATRDTVGRAFALAGLVGAGIAVVLILGLTLAVSRVDPVRRTISEYALHPDLKPVFDVGVLAFAAAALCVLVAHARAGLVRAVSGASSGLVLAAVGLVAVVVFEKTNWAVGPSVGGTIHRYASLVAFLALPVAAILVARRYRRAAAPERGPWARPAAWVRWLAVASLLWFTPILVGFAQRPFTGVSWWQAVPLGLIERGLALTEVLVVVALGLWGLAAARRTPVAPSPDVVADSRSGREMSRD